MPYIFWAEKNRDGSINEPSQQKDTWSRFWAILKLSHLDFSCIWLHVRHVSFDDFLSHLTIPPVTVLTFSVNSCNLWELWRCSYWPFQHWLWIFSKTILVIKMAYLKFAKLFCENNWIKIIVWPQNKSVTSPNHIFELK